LTWDDYLRVSRSTPFSFQLRAAPDAYPRKFREESPALFFEFSPFPFSYKRRRSNVVLGRSRSASNTRHYALTSLFPFVDDSFFPPFASSLRLSFPDLDSLLSRTRRFLYFDPRFSLHPRFGLVLMLVLGDFGPRLPGLLLCFHFPLVLFSVPNFRISSIPVFKIMPF